MAEAVGSDTALFGVPVALDIPKLQHVEEVAEAQAVEVIGVKALLRVAQLHGADERLEREIAAVAATGAVRIRLGHDHAPVPEVLGHPVVKVVITGDRKTACDAK